jgi:hypothetical protein
MFRWNDNILVGLHKKYYIGWAEALAVEVGLHLTVHHNLFNKQSPHSLVPVKPGDSVIDFALDFDPILGPELY